MFFPHPSGFAQGEDVQSLPSPSSSVLAFPDVVLRVGLPSGRRSVGDLSQEIPVVLAPGKNLAPTSRDLEVVGMADKRLPIAFDLSDGDRETINSAKALYTRRLYSSKWKVFFNPGAWFMLWIQSAAQLVQCWSSCKISFRLEWPLPP